MEWRELQTCACLTPFQTFDWVNLWLNKVGIGNRVYPVIIVLRNARGTPTFVVPLAIRTSGGLRALTWLGSQINDYNAPILGSDDADFAHIYNQFPYLWAEVIMHLKSIHTCRFDFVDFSKMPMLVGSRKNPFIKLAVNQNPNRAHMTSLPASWEKMYARRSSSTRSRDRSKLRRLSEFGEVKYIEPKTTVEKLAVTRKLLLMKSGQLADMGARNRFDSENYRNFIEAVTSLDCTVHVSALQVGTAVVAANLGFIFNKCYYHFLMAYDRGAVSKFGPGATHLRELLQFAIRSGAETFDFTIGDESYKKDWCDREMQLYDHLEAQTMLGRIGALAVKIFNSAKRLIKNNVWVWHKYLKLRFVLAKLKGRRSNPALN